MAYLGYITIMETHTEITESKMEQGFILLKDGEIVSKEEDIGIASELKMVLSEMNPNSKIEIREFIGCMISSE